MVSTKKRLTFVLEHYWGQCQGGAELQTHYLENEAIRQGWMTHYCFLSNGNQIEKNHDTLICPIPKKSIWNKLGNLHFPYAIDVYRALRKTKPDVIYQRCASALTGIAAIYAKNNNCQLTFHIAHDRDINKTSRFWIKPSLIPEYILMQYGIKNANTIIAQTQFQAEQLINNYDRKAIIIPNGHPVPKDCVKTDAKKTILWIANWKSFKQPEIFVRLAEEFGRGKDYRFIMVGRTGKYNSLVQRARKNNIEVMGEISNDQVNDLLTQSHVLVNTSQQEGFSNTFIQAWMRRVPVVSYKVDPDNILQNEYIGFCSSGNFTKLVQNTRELIKNQKLRDTMGARAREYAMKHHSLKNMNKILEAMLR